MIKSRRPKGLSHLWWVFVVVYLMPSFKHDWDALLPMFKWKVHLQRNGIVLFRNACPTVTFRALSDGLP